MCNILVNNEGISNVGYVKQSIASNRHGNGYAKWNGKTWDVTKEMTSNPKDIVGSHVFHSRIATGSAHTVDQCHPFDLGNGRLLFHNGICGASTTSKSDTNIVTDWLKDKSDEEVIQFLEHGSIKSDSIAKITSDNAFNKWLNVRETIELDGYSNSGRWVLLTADGLIRRFGGGWSKLKDETYSSNNSVSDYGYQRYNNYR